MTIEVVVGSTWRGLSQNSWWLVQAIDVDYAVALCMKEPEQYQWARAGEIHRLRLAGFRDWMEPL